MHGLSSGHRAKDAMQYMMETVKPLAHVMFSRLKGKETTDYKIYDWNKFKRRIDYGSKKTETPPPKFQPVMMDDQGNYYKENPEYTKKMAKLRSHPFTMMGAAKNPSKFKKDGMPDNT